MLNFMKVPPTTYVMLYKYGKIKREGAGLSFFYYGPTSTIVAVPIASTDMPFVFQEVMADFQTVNIQGQFTYRVADPKQLASLLDFSVDNRRAYTSDDPRKLRRSTAFRAATAPRSSSQAGSWFRPVLARRDGSHRFSTWPLASRASVVENHSREFECPGKIHASYI